MLGYSLTNYDSKNCEYRQPVFKNTTNISAHNSGYNKNSQATQQPDTFSLNTNTQLETEEKKHGLSKGAKWGLGTLAVIGLGTIAYVLSKGKVRSKQAQHIIEQAEFKPAQTIEDAIRFGQDKLKISYNDYQYANLDILNTINEMCSKNIKQGKAFDVIHFEKPGTCNIENPMSFSPICEGGFNARVLRINTDYINKFDDLIEYVFKHDDGININEIIRRNKNGSYSITKQEYSSAPLNKLINKLNTYNNKSSYKEKLEIYDGFSELVASYGDILKGRNSMRDFSFDGSFLHETGHSMHYSTNQKYFNALLDKKNELVKEFHRSAEEKQTALKVSNYAANDPLEFVAEVWKGIQRGKIYSNDVMALYKKYGGPSIT